MELVFRKREELLDYWARRISGKGLTCKTAVPSARLRNLLTVLAMFCFPISYELTRTEKSRHIGVSSTISSFQLSNSTDFDSYNRSEIWGLNMYEVDDAQISTVDVDGNITILAKDMTKIKYMFVSRSPGCEFVSGNLTLRNRTNFSAVATINSIVEWEHPLFICTIPYRPISFRAEILLKPDEGNKLLALWVVLYAICLIGSGTFTGLSISLISLDVETLELIRDNDTDENTRMYATNILPLRRNVNYTITTIIIGNTFCNTAASVLFTYFTADANIESEGLKMFILIFAPSFVIMFFGEIIPQIICCKFALKIGNHLRYLMIFLMVATVFVSWPLAKMLDCIIGKETRTATEKIQIDQYATQKKSEKHLQVAQRAMNYELKLAHTIMTPIDRVFMISHSTLVNNELKQQLSQYRHTRIPVYREEDKQIIGVMNMKDLMLIKESWNLTVGTVMQLWYRSTMLVYAPEGTLVVDLMNDLRKRVPLAIIFKFDPNHRKQTVVGIVTLEDNLEEFLGEINDEKDMKLENRTLAPFTIAEQMPKSELSQKLQIRSPLPKGKSSEMA